MTVLRTMSIAQRGVLVVGLGLSLAAGWAWWYIGELQNTGGWFAYAPGTMATDTYYIVQQRQPKHLLVPLALVAVWTAASLWLLRLRRGDAA